MNKKILFVIIPIGLSIVILAYFSSLSGLYISTNQKDIQIQINNEEVPYIEGGKIKLDPGNYRVYAYKEGFRHKELEVKVGYLGKTNLLVELDELQKKGINGLPYDGSGFSINAGVTEFKESSFRVYYVSSQGKTEATDWLSKKGITEQNSVIEYVEEVDREGEKDVPASF